MKNNKTRKKWLFGLFAFLLCFLLAGCENEKKGSGVGKSVVIPVASGKKVLEGEKLKVDISHLELGYLMVQYQGTAPKLYVQLVGPDQLEYKYFMEPSSEYVTIPMTAGDGDYYFCVYENVTDEQYSPILSRILSLELEDEFSPFLCSNQYVNFTMDCETVKKGQELTAECESDLEKVQAIYEWVTRNIEYDFDKAVNVSPGYLPNVDETLKTGQGICFDFSALMTAMLRSIGIPTKLEIGYLTGNIYHAWISIYLDEIGWVDQMIRFDGESWHLMDPTVASSSGTGKVEKMAEDDANYIVRYVR